MPHATFPPEERQERRREVYRRSRLKRREAIKAYKRANRLKANEQARARRAKNPEKFRAAYHTWRQAHPEQARQATKRWRETNPEKVREQKQRWNAANVEATRRHKRTRYARHRELLLETERAKRAANPEPFREGKRRSYQRNKATYIARAAQWLKNHPDYARAACVKRRARKKSAPLNDLTIEQHQAVLAAAKGVCAYCHYYKPGCLTCKRGKHALTIDHITALARGGSHTLHNLVACCRSCNARKHAGPVPGPVQPLLL